MAWCTCESVAEALLHIALRDDQEARAAATRRLDDLKESVNFADALVECIKALSPYNTISPTWQLCADSAIAESLRLTCALYLARLLESTDVWNEGRVVSDKAAVVDAIIGVTYEQNIPRKLLDAVVRCLAQICLSEFPKQQWRDMLDRLFPVLWETGLYRDAGISFISNLCSNAHRNVELWRTLAVASHTAFLPCRSPFAAESLNNCASCQDHVKNAYEACYIINKLLAKRPVMPQQDIESMVAEPLHMIAELLLTADITEAERIAAAVDGGLPTTARLSLESILDPAFEAPESTGSSPTLCFVAGTIGCSLSIVQHVRHEETLVQLCHWIVAVIQRGLPSSIVCRSLTLELLEALQTLLSNSTTRDTMFSPESVMASVLDAVVKVAVDRDFFSDPSVGGVYECDYFSDIMSPEELVEGAAASLLHDCLTDDRSVPGSGCGTLRDVAGSIAQLLVDSNECVTFAPLTLAHAIEILNAFCSTGGNPQPSGPGVTAFIPAHMALAVITDVAKQCSERGICLLATFDAGRSAELLRVISTIAISSATDGMQCTSNAMYAASAVIRSRAMLCMAACVDQAEDADALQTAISCCEHKFNSITDSNPLICMEASTAALVLGRVCAASALAVEHLGRRLRPEHVAAAVHVARSPYGTHTALIFCRDAVALGDAVASVLLENSDALNALFQAFVTHSATSPALCSPALGLLNALIEEHPRFATQQVCMSIQRLCGIILQAVPSAFDRLMRIAIESASKVILSAQAEGGCFCSPHLGDLVYFIVHCAARGPFDDSLTRCVASCIGSCATVDFAAAVPGESISILADAATQLLAGSAAQSSAAFNNSCMAYGVSLIAIGLREGTAVLGSHFMHYLTHLGKFLATDAPDLILGGCFLPLAVMVAADPLGTAESISLACQIQGGSPPHERHTIALVLSTWLAVVPHSDLRIQSYTLAAWHQWIAIAQQSAHALFVLCQFGPDVTAAVSPDSVVRYKFIRTLHPKKEATTAGSSVPAAVLRDATPVTFIEGALLATTVLSNPQAYKTIRLGTFADHEAYDKMNLWRWRQSESGLPLPPDITNELLYGAGHVLVPFLAERLPSASIAHLGPDVLARMEMLRSALLPTSD